MARKPKTETKPRANYEPLRNPRHETFAQMLALGRTPAQAYQIAGYRAGDPASSASALRLQEDIAGRVLGLQRTVAERTVVTMETLIDELDEARLLARDVAQPGAMVSATKEKAILLGLRVEKRDMTTRSGDPKGMTDDELAAIARAGGNGDAATPGDPKRPQRLVH